MVLFANQVADKLAKEGISVEVIDPRTISPLDTDSIIESVEKTGRLVVVDEANPICSVASEIVECRRLRSARVSRGPGRQGDGAAHAGAGDAESRGGIPAVAREDRGRDPQGARQERGASGG
jgi:hypothetical protein